MKLLKLRKHKWSLGDRQKLNCIANLISSGGIGIFPTDTVYGIGVSPKYSRSVQKIYRFKKRERNKPLVNLIGYKKDTSLFVRSISTHARRLIKKFWPGPLTIILKTPRGTVGLRMPNHKIVLALLRKTGPLATTSANISGQSPPIEFNQINKGLLKKIDFALDGGRAPLKKVSTIVDCTGEDVRILRKGVVSEKRIREAAYRKQSKLVK